MASLDPAVASSSSATPAPPKTLVEYTITTAPWNVIKGTTTFALLGGVTGSTIGVVRNLPALPAAFTTAINTGMFSFSFFNASASWNPHFHNFLPTSLAGFTAGSFFSYVMRATSRASVRAGVTLSLGCTTLQSVFNEVELLRIGAILRSELREGPTSRRGDGFSIVRATIDPSPYNITIRARDTRDTLVNDNGLSPPYITQQERLLRAVPQLFDRSGLQDGNLCRAIRSPAQFGLDITTLLPLLKEG